MLKAAYPENKFVRKDISFAMTFQLFTRLQNKSLLIFL